MVQLRYTFGAEIEETTYHHSAIRNQVGIMTQYTYLVYSSYSIRLQLTRSLGVVLPDVHKEIEMALEETVQGHGSIQLGL
jgi:hypothetical protein